MTSNSYLSCRAFEKGVAASLALMQLLQLLEAHITELEIKEDYLLTGWVYTTFTSAQL